MILYTHICLLKLGPTQTYHPSLHLIRTPTKRAQQECTPSPEPFHVSTDVTADDEEDEEYEREKLMWGTWREDQLIQLRHRIKKLEWEKLCLESRLFPNANDWFRNKRLATAVETKEGGVPKYSNDQPFGGPRLQLQNQMIGREIKRKFKELSSVGMNHPALQAKQTSDAGSNSNKL